MYNMYNICQNALFVKLNIEVSAENVGDKKCVLNKVGAGTVLLISNL